jgi:hypothetical protein
MFLLLVSTWSTTIFFLLEKKNISTKQIELWYCHILAGSSVRLNDGLSRSSITSSSFKPIRFLLKFEKLIPIIGRAATRFSALALLFKRGSFNLDSIEFVVFMVEVFLAGEARGVLTIVFGSYVQALMNQSKKTFNVIKNKDCFIFVKFLVLIRTV